MFRYLPIQAVKAIPFVTITESVSIRLSKTLLFIKIAEHMSVRKKQSFVQFLYCFKTLRRFE